jgi:multimeric flavodoxin WrbA
LNDQARIRLDDFVAAGRSESLSFDQIYQNLKSLRSDQGLSNSEVVLAAGLWGAYQLGCDIEHVGLSQHFPANSTKGSDLEGLKARLMAADAILLSTPVYFGDRSSVAHDLIELMRSDSEITEAMRGKVCAGISVGAKRNGGQETSLIYQLLDLTGIGMLGVGNDSDTTSQYGGTAHAGDVGTVGRDEYGLNTSVGAGKRIGHVAGILKAAQTATLSGRLRVQIWLLQDCRGEALQELNQIVEFLTSMPQPQIEVTLLDLTESEIHRCIACDICPTHVGNDEEYRCIVHRGTDALVLNHDRFLEPDVIIVAAHSPIDRAQLKSSYQRFMERTRYLRRGDYVLSDVVVAPLIFEELGSKENLHLRILTSMLRHHTIMTHPIIQYIQDGQVLNRQSVHRDLEDLVFRAAQVTTGRCVLANREPPVTHYNPVGYVLSTAKDKESATIQRRELAVAARNHRMVEDARDRIEYKTVPSPSSAEAANIQSWATSICWGTASISLN